MIKGEDNLSRGKALVHFSTLDDAKNMYNQLNELKPPLKINGRKVIVEYTNMTVDKKLTNSWQYGDWICPYCQTHNFARRKECFGCNVARGPNAIPVESEKPDTSYSNPPPMSSIMIRGLPFDYVDGGIEMAIQNAMGGPTALALVKSIRVVRERNTGNCRGFAFVDFKEVHHARELFNRTGGMMDMYGHVLTIEYSTSGQKKRSKSEENYSTVNNSHQSYDNMSVYHMNAPLYYPEGSEFVYDEEYGYYRDKKTGLYYDATSGYYFDREKGEYYFYDQTKNCFTPWGQSSHLTSISETDSSIKTETTNEEKADNASKEKLVDKEEKNDKMEVEKDVNNGDKMNEESDQKIESIVINQEKTKKSSNLKSKKLAANLDKWNQVSKELSSSPSSSVVEEPISSSNKETGPVSIKLKKKSAPVVFVQDEPDDTPTVKLPKLTAPEPVKKTKLELYRERQLLFDHQNPETLVLKTICLLCRRKLASPELLQKHLTLSKLHKKNLEVLANQSDREVIQSYRDRAAERRSLLGEYKKKRKQNKREDLGVPSKHAKVQDQDDVDVDLHEGTVEIYPKQTQPAENVGLKIIQKMGWTGGGLGRQETGRVKPIEVKVRLGRSGLGSEQPYEYSIENYGNLTAAEKVKLTAKRKWEEMNRNK